MLSERFTERLVTTTESTPKTENESHKIQRSIPRRVIGAGVGACILGVGLFVVITGKGVDISDSAGQFATSFVQAHSNRSMLHVNGTAEKTSDALPKWVEMGILHTTRQLQNAQDSLASLQASTAKLEQTHLALQKEVGDLTAENMQLKVQLRQAEHTAETERLALQEAQVAHTHAPGNVTLPQIHDGHAPMVIQSRNVTSKNGIVALANTPKPIANDGHQDSASAKGWLTIAVHGSNAVLQTPAGQVAMVHVGSQLDGATVTSIDDSNNVVVLNHHQQVFPPK